MAGFVRRLPYGSSIQQIAAIEGIVLISLPPPGIIQGITEGIAGLVAEFQNFSLSCAVNTSGQVTSTPGAIQIFSAGDLQTYLGGFDTTLGNFGNRCGNGFVELRNKGFTALVALPVCLASTTACRVWRELPTNTSATNPQPAVPGQAGLALAGTQFLDPSNDRINIGGNVSFTTSQPKTAGTDGTTTAVVGAATHGIATGGAGPFNVLPGATFNVKVNGSTETDNTFAGSAGYLLGTSASFPLTNTAATLNFTVNSVACSASIGMNTTELAAIDAINVGIAAAGVVGYCTDASGQLKIVSGIVGQAGTVAVTGSTIATALGFTNPATAPVTTIDPGSGPVSVSIQNMAAATAAELAIALDLLSIAAATFSVVGGDLTFSTNTAGASKSVQVLGTGSTSLGFDNAVYSGTAAGPGTAATNPFISTSGAFIANMVSVGDALVVGVAASQGGSGSQLSAAGTYRIVSVDSATQVTVQQQNAVAFTFPTASTLVWRIQPASDADSGGTTALTNPAGNTVVVRTLDATTPAATVCTPTLPQPSQSTGATWTPLAGLGLITHPTTTLSFNANLQAPNVGPGVWSDNGAAMDAAYTASLQALMQDIVPNKTVDIVWAARTSTLIRSGIEQIEQARSAVGVGLVGSISPDLTVQTVQAAGATTDPGVGALRDEGLYYCWPNVQTFVPEAADLPIVGGDGNTYTDGLIDLQAAGWLASILSNLAPELNPAQSAPPVPSLMAPITGYARGVTPLMLSDWIFMKQQGICGPRFDSDDGSWGFQSGVTTSLTPGETNINRLRMEYFIQDSLAAGLKSFAKGLVTDAWKSNIDTEITAFLEGLLSQGNPSLQRIAGYRVDNQSGNTAATAAAGVYVDLVYVQTLITGDVIALMTQVGTTVNVTPASGN